MPTPMIDPESGLLAAWEPAQPFPVGPTTIDAALRGVDPETPALITDDATLSYSELDQASLDVARRLVNLGVEPGDRVAWILPNGPDAVVAAVATVRAGGLWVGIDPRTTETERRNVLAPLEPRLTLDSLPDAVVGEAIELPEPDADRPAAIALTSGTTGDPKAAVHLHQQLLYPGAASMVTEPVGANERIATPLSLSTLNLMLLVAFTSLSRGAAVVFVPSAPAELAPAIARHRVTRLLVVPTTLFDLASAAEPAQLECLRTILIGGAGIDHDRALAAERALGVPLTASYGLSEAPTGVARMRVGASGANPLPGVDVAVGADGEITLAPTASGPWAKVWRPTIGYWGRPDATAALWRNGRLATGDAGTLDKNGLLLVTGRTSEMINRGGATIAPAEIESVLLGIDGVADAAVVGVPDERLGQRVAAAVVTERGDDELRAAVRRELSGYKTPDRWVRMPSIPRNRNGKIDRAAVQAAFDG